MTALIQALASAIAGLMVGFLVTNKHNIKQIQLESITKNRMEWINKFRENVSIMLAAGETLSRDYPDFIELSDERRKEAISYRTQYDEAKNSILLVLNLSEEDNRLIYKEIIKLDISDYKNFQKRKYILMYLVRSFLKPEWERVKKLSKGSEN